MKEVITSIIYYYLMVPTLILYAKDIMDLVTYKDRNINRTIRIVFELCGIALIKLLFKRF